MVDSSDPETIEMPRPLPEVRVSDESAALTEKQRRYLNNTSDIESKSAEERAIRARIRDRLSRTVFDLVLMNNLEDRDLEKAFQPYEFNPRGGHEYGSDALALVLDGLSRAAQASQHFPGDSLRDDETSVYLESLLESALESVYSNQGTRIKNIQVDYNIEYGPTVDEILAREIDQISHNELEILLQEDEITEREFFKISKIFVRSDMIKEDLLWDEQQDRYS